MALKHPERVQDLLGYSSMITKASLDYEGTPWLAYDAHFRRLAAANRLTQWSQVEASLWTNYFTSAKLSKGASGLAIVPSPTKDGGPEGPSEVATGSRAARQRATAPYSILGEICRAWNFSRCTRLHCKSNHICMDCHSPGHPAKVCRVTRSLAETASDNPSPPFPRGGLVEARGSEQIESVVVNHDFPHDPDLITHWEPFDGPCQHPIRETAPPMNTDELFCIGHIDTNQLIQLESCKPTPEHLISIPSSASHIVMPLLPHRWEGLLRQHPDQALAAYVVSGLSNGFHIGYQYSSSRRSSLSCYQPQGIPGQ